MNLEELACQIQRCLKRSSAIQIEGLGVFSRNSCGDISFSRSNHPRVFVSYSVEDAAFAERLFSALCARGFSAWIDRQRLLPGQNWQRRIEDAIASSDFFIACFSKTSVRKRGGFQAEIRYALYCAARVPLDDVFIIPVRLDDCRVPSRIGMETQYVDLFPDWCVGLNHVFQIIERQTRRALQEM
jgi:hypothetical protein